MGKTIFFIFLTGSFFILAIGTAKAQTSSYEELQAAYIFNFAKYIKWPEEGPTFVIGIYGNTEIIPFFEKHLSGKKVRTKAIEWRIISKLEHLTGVSIVYVSESASKNIKTLTTAIEGKSILIVTEDDLIKKGAAISFVVEEDRLKFKLKKTALKQVGLVASEGLLKLAILE